MPEHVLKRSEAQEELLAKIAEVQKLVVDFHKSHTLQELVTLRAEALLPQAIKRDLSELLVLWVLHDVDNDSPQHMHTILVLDA